MPKTNQIIAVDIDGTLFERFDFLTGESFEPNYDIIHYVNRLYDSGGYIIIYTSRLERDRLATEYSLKKHGLKYHALVMEKLKADLYIDDKALNVEDINL